MGKEGAVVPKWTAAQKQAIDSGEDLGVIAGAGSGKTTVLVARLIRILQERHCSLSQIVAITFTNKAAAEMKERLREKIEEQLGGKDDAYWRELIEALPSAQISTIHSLCARILREHPQQSSVDPLFSVLAEDEGRLLLEEAAQESVLELASQREGLLRLLAAHGKERVLGNLLALYHKLRSEGMQPETVWKESREKLCERRPNMVAQAQAVEELAGDLLSFNPDDLTAKGREQQADFAQAWHRAEVIRERLLAGEADLELEALTEFLKVGTLIDARGKMASLVKELKEALELLAEEIAQIRSLDGVHDFCLLLSELDRNYSQRKRELGALDFADLELVCCRLLKRHPELRDAYQRSFKYLLVDEYQDTSRLQEQLLSSLYMLGENCLFVVGDPKQSIYRFRGAEVAVFGETVAKIQAAGGKEIELVDNFRTTKPLIALYNHLFQELLDGEITYQPLTAHRSGQVLPELLLAFPKEGDDAEAKRQREAQLLSGRIQRLVMGGELTIEDKNKGPRPVSWGDIAILFRSTTNLPIYQQELAAAGIPHYVVGGSGYYAKQEVQDVLNMLRWLENTKDQVALAGVLRSPFFSLSDATLFWLTRKTSLDLGLFLDPLPPQIKGPQREAVQWARSLLREFFALRTLPLDQLIERILERTGYSIAIVGDFLGRQKLQNLQKLIGLARRFSQEGLVTPGQFLERVEGILAQELREGEAPLEGEEEDTVKLLTIHKSKGLEYPVVVVPDFSRGLNFGSSSFFAYSHGQLALDCGEIEAKPPRYTELAQKEKLAELEESKRVLYVALTRARDHLILSGSAEKPKPGGIEEQGSWLDWLAVLMNVSNWEEAESLPYDGGAIQVITGDPAIPPSEEEVSLQLEEQELPLLFGAKVDPAAISPTHPPLTPSSFITYAACPRRYFYSYRWRVDDTKLGLLETREARGIAGWQRGQVLHRACEKIHPDSDAVAALREAFAFYQLEAGEHLLVELIPIVERYQRNELCSTLATAHSEWPFAVGLGPYIMEGSLDKLLPGKIPQVVDFKSNLVGNDDIAALTSYYKPQLECYAYAVHKRLGATEVELALHYLMVDETVRWRIRDWQVLEQKLVNLADQIIGREREEEFEFNYESCSSCRFARYRLCPGALSGEEFSAKMKTS